MTNNILKFKEKINSAKVAVLGLGISNIPLIRFLCECGVKDITAYDKFASPQVISNIEMLKKDNMIKSTELHEKFGAFSAISKTLCHKFGKSRMVLLC